VTVCRDCYATEKKKKRKKKKKKKKNILEYRTRKEKGKKVLGCFGRAGGKEKEPKTLVVDVIERESQKQIRKGGGSSGGRQLK